MLHLVMLIWKSGRNQKASIHHHFPKKEDLGAVIIESYIQQSILDFERIEQDFPNAFGRLCAFASFRAAMSDGMLPLCGALAAEMAALPDKLQVLTRQYFEIQLKWIKKLLMKELHAVNYLLKVTHTKSFSDFKFIGRQ